MFLVYNSVRCRYRQQWANQLDKILPTGEKLKQWSIKDDLRCYNTSPPKMLRPHALNTMQTVPNRSGVDGRSGKFESGISKPGNRLVSVGGRHSRRSQMRLPCVAHLRPLNSWQYACGSDARYWRSFRRGSHLILRRAPTIFPVDHNHTSAGWSLTLRRRSSPFPLLPTAFDPIQCSCH